MFLLQEVCCEQEWNISPEWKNPSKYLTLISSIVSDTEDRLSSSDEEVLVKPKKQKKEGTYVITEWPNKFDTTLLRSFWNMRYHLLAC